MIRLARRRQVWLPTLWGALLSLVLLCAVSFALLLSAYPLLAPQQPARGPAGDGARTLVVEGWLDRDELAQAVEWMRRTHYVRVVTTGGPIDAWSDVGSWGNHAQRAAAYLRANLPADVPVTAVPTPGTPLDRTWLSAVTLRDWAVQNKVQLDAIDLYTAGVHARRSWLVYRMALGDGTEVGVLSARPSDYDPQRWWISSSGAKAVLGETLSLAWTRCCFWPARGAALGVISPAPP